MSEISREELIERWNNSCKPYQEIIDKVTFEECLCVISGIPISCNHEEMIIRAIYQKVLKLEKIEKFIDEYDDDEELLPSDYMDMIEQILKEV